MTSPTDNDPADAGFTLIEMIVVLAILAASVGLLVAHGPTRSAALDLRVAADQVARALRGAQARAIATDRPVAVTLTRHAYQVTGGAPVVLPDAVDLSSRTNSGAIGFAPDGSSTGGEIALVSGSRQMRIVVNWLTGHVKVLDGA